MPRWVKEVWCRGRRRMYESTVARRRDEIASRRPAAILERSRNPEEPGVDSVRVHLLRRSSFWLFDFDFDFEFLTGEAHRADYPGFDGEARILSIPLAILRDLEHAKSPFLFSVRGLMFASS